MITFVWNAIKTSIYTTFNVMRFLSTSYCVSSMYISDASNSTSVCVKIILYECVGHSKQEIKT